MTEETQGPEVVEAKQLLEELGVVTDGIRNRGERAAHKKNLLQQVGMQSSSAYVESHATYYAERYPLYRYISKKKLQEVCEKYNLYIAEIGKYTGDIPMTSLRAVADFKETGLRAEDWPYGTETDRRKLERLTKEYRATMNYSWWKRLSGAEKKKLKHEAQVPRYSWRRESGLHICANIKDLNMQVQDRIEGRFIVKDDPIVVQPVNHGYLIITAWGPESFDEDVINPINN